MFSSVDNKQHLHISATTTGLKSQHSNTFRNKVTSSNYAHSLLILYHNHDAMPKNWWYAVHNATVTPILLPPK